MPSSVGWDSGWSHLPRVRSQIGRSFTCSIIAALALLKVGAIVIFWGARFHSLAESMTNVDFEICNLAESLNILVGLGLSITAEVGSSCV